MDFFFFNFVIGHNRKFPSGLTETHNVDIPERATKGLTGGMKTCLLRFVFHYGFQNICCLLTPE